MLQLLGILGGLISGLSYIPYIKDVLAKKTRPERASWIIWATLTAIAFFSQLAKGATSSLWLPFFETLGTSIVFLLSIKNGVGGATKRDIFILISAAIGLVLWYFTKEPAVALYIVIAVDATGTIPTIIKSYQEPETETFITWIMVTIAGIFAMFSVGKLDLILLSYPFYIFAANGAIALAMVLGKKKRVKRAKH